MYNIIECPWKGCLFRLCKEFLLEVMLWNRPKKKSRESLLYILFNVCNWLKEQKSRKNRVTKTENIIVKKRKVLTGVTVDENIKINERGVDGIVFKYFYNTLKMLSYNSITVRWCIWIMITMLIWQWDIKSLWLSKTFSKHFLKLATKFYEHLVSWYFYELKIICFFFDLKNY